MSAADQLDWGWDDEREAAPKRDDGARTVSSRTQKRRWRCPRCGVRWHPVEGALCYRCAGTWPRYRTLLPMVCLDCGKPAPRDGMHQCKTCREKKG